MEVGCFRINCSHEGRNIGPRDWKRESPARISSLFLIREEICANQFITSKLWYGACTGLHAVVCYCHYVEGKVGALRVRVEIASGISKYSEIGENFINEPVKKGG